MSQKTGVRELFWPPLPIKSVIKNVFGVGEELAYPIEGSIVYCDFLVAEHSGVYIGNNKIVHLNRFGKIEAVAPEDFTGLLGGKDIYVSYNGKLPAGNEITASNARQRVGDDTDYNVFFNNCHQFTSSCMTGDFDNADSFLWMLKDRAKEEMSATDWKVWGEDINSWTYTYIPPGNI